jgi:hypothetical protein
VRRLLWLTLGFGLAWYGFGLIAGGDGFATYRLRDGLLVALIGALLFAWHTAPLAPLASSGGQRQWHLWGRILFGTGFVCGAAATLLLTLWGAQSWAGWLGNSLWAVGVLALLVGLFWPGRVEIYPAPAFRWRVDAAGNYVRYALDDPDQTADPAPLLSTWHHPLNLSLVAILLGVGVLLRVWRLTSLPATCVDVECALALQLVEGGWPQGFHAEALSLFALLTRAIYSYTGESVGALRWASAILGSLTLPAIYWTARAYVKPAGALVTLLVMALLPWAVWSSRLGSVWSAAPLLLALVLGMAGHALQRPSPRWWGFTGITLGLLLMQPLPLWGATVVWLLLLAGAAWWAQGQVPGQTESGSRRRLIDQAVVMVGCALTVGLPLALPLWRAALLAEPAAATTAYGPMSMVAGLLDSGGATLDYFMRQPLLLPWSAALAWVGLATLLRWARQPRAAVVAVGLLLYAVALLGVIPPWVASGLVSATMSTTVLTLPIVSAAEAWLPLLPFVALAIGFAADQWLTTFDRAWSSFLPLPRAVTVALLALALLAGRGTLALMGQLGRAGATAQSETEVAIGQYLARCLRDEASDDPCSRQGENPPIFYVPPAALNHPATRLLLGSAQQSGQVRPFDPGRDLLPSTTPTGDLFYLVALENQPVIELLRQLYPTAQMHAEPTDRVGPTLFLVIQIPLADVLSHQGLVGRYYAGGESTGTALETRIDGPLRFAWGSEPPLDAPFSVIWEGSLLVPSAGTYFFEIAGLQGNSATGPDAPVINLQLDGNLVLDSSLGLTEKPEKLAQGAYQVTLRYRTSTHAADWALRWTPPGGQPEEIPRTQFYSPPLPNIGLIGTYYAGNTWDGPILTTRKEMVLGTPVDLPAPYSVHWTGKLAAARAGEYFFAVTANGPVTLLLNGRETLIHLPSTDLASGPGYSQASIYLEKGWHTVDLRYAPANVSDLRVLWQPPGSGPLLLAGRYLLPTPAPVTISDLPLPLALELIDARLGNEDFALSANLEAYQPSLSLPPASLPLLIADPVWSVANGCGAGAAQFASPRGVALDAENGRVYVADSENRRVVELRLDDGTQVTSYALPEFQEPVDVAIDPQGALLALDAMTQSIFRIDRATGESATLVLATSFYRPRGLAVDRAGNIAVADTGGARVAVLDGAGSFLTQYGGLETAVGQGQPVDVLALGDQWWTIAADHGRLWRLDVMGSVPVSERTNTLTGPQLAGLPDGSGFFLSDPVRRTVLYLAPSGQPVGQLGYADAFVNPMGVATSFREDGFVNLVVGDSAACTVGLWRLRTE